MLEDIPGIGTDRAASLRGAGIESAQDLAEADPIDVQEATTAEGWRAKDWIESAKELTESDADKSKSEPAQPNSEIHASTPASEETDSDVKTGSDTEADAQPQSEFERLWQSLSANQKKVAQEWVFVPTKAEAAEAANLQPSTVYSWPNKVWEAAEMLVDQRAQGLTQGLSALSPSALDVLRRALSPDGSVSRVESETAQYLINRLKGKPTRKQQIEHSGGIDLGEDDEDALDEALAHFDDDEGED